MFNPSPRRRKILVVVILLTMLLPVLASALSAAPASAATRRAVDRFETDVAARVNLARKTARVGALATTGTPLTCHTRVADKAAARVTSTGTLASRYVAAARSCPTPLLGFASAHRATSAAAATAMLRQARSRAVLLHRAGRTLAVAAHRNPDGTWSTALLVGGTAPTTTTPTTPTTPDDTSAAGQMRAGIYQHTNIARSDAGLSALSTEGCLEKNAQAWAEHLAAKGGLEHQDLGTVFTLCGNRGLLGENVAYNFTSDGSVMVTQWMNSPGHRANILNGSFTRIGVGTAQDSEGRWFGVQVFGGTPW